MSLKFLHFPSHWNVALLWILIPPWLAVSSESAPMIGLSTKLATEWQTQTLVVFDNFEQDSFQEDYVAQLFSNSIYATVMDLEHLYDSELLDKDEDGNSVFEFFSTVACTECLAPQEAKDLVEASKHVLLSDQETIMDQLDLSLKSEVFVFNEDDLSVSEVYAIKNGPRIKSRLGFFDEVLDDFSFEGSENMWQRRKDLQGITLMATHLPFPPLSAVGPEGELSGYLVDIWNIFAEKLNFTYEVIPPEDGNWGGLEDDGSFNGMIGQVARKDVDCSIASMSSTLLRQEHVDFTHTVYKDISTLIAKKQSAPAMNLYVYFDSMYLTSWLGIFSFVCIIALLLSLLPILSIDKIHGKSDREQFGLCNALAMVLILMVQRDYSIDKRAVTTRVLFFTACMFAFFIFACYSAILTSTMISKPKEVSIATFREMINQDLKIVVWKNTAIHTLFQEAPEGTELNEVYTKLIANNPKSLGATQHEMISLLMSQENAYSFDTPITYMGMNNVTLVKGFTQTVNFPYSFAFTKGSEFLDLFNFHLLQAEQAGIIGKLLIKWDLKADTAVEKGGETASELGYDNLAFPFVSLCLGVMGSFVLLLWEGCKKTMGRLRKKRRERRRSSRKGRLVHVWPV